MEKEENGTQDFKRFESKVYVHKQDTERKFHYDENNKLWLLKPFQTLIPVGLSKPSQFAVIGKFYNIYLGPYMHHQQSGGLWA